VNQRAQTQTQIGPTVEIFDKIVAISGPESSGLEPTGFHLENLEVAAISPEAETALAFLKSSATARAEGLDEALEELKAWNGSINQNVKPGTLHFGPRSITINVTQVCNLHCTYCAAGGDGTFGDPIKKISVEKTIPQLKAFLERVPEGRKFHITFLGGEPLLYPEGIALLAEYVKSTAKERSISSSFTVVTNGTLFSPANIELLAKLKANLIISVDGPPELNDRTRPTASGRGVTLKVIEGIELLLQRKSELGTVELSGVFGQQNQDLMAAYEFYSQFSVDHMDFTYDHLETSAEVSEQYTARLLAVASRAFQENGEAGLRKIKTFDRIFELLDKQQQVQNYCGAGKSFFMIDARNQIYTCPWVAGDSKEVVGVGSELWVDKLKAYEAPLTELNQCGSCWARNLCGGGCMFIHKNKTGSKHKVDDNFCNRTRLLIAQGIMYYKIARSGVASAERKAL